MSMWSKNPLAFSQKFHQVIEERLNSLGVFPLYRAAWRERQHFYAFRRALRRFPAHPLHAVEMSTSIQTKIVRLDGDAWDLQVKFHTHPDACLKESFGE